MNLRTFGHVGLDVVLVVSVWLVVSVVLEVSLLVGWGGGEVVLAVNFLHWLQKFKFLLWLSLE